MILRACAALLFAAMPLVASADAVRTSHGLSAFGDLKYPPDFTHFDYVNPDAPKRGKISTTSTFALQTFDSFNPFIVKGDAPAEIITMVFDTLMVRAFDEPDAVYGLVAESVEYIPGQWVIFNLRPEAKFADGSPITAEDVKASFDLLTKQGRPVYRLAFDGVESVEVLDTHRIRYNFHDDAPTRLLPMRIAGLPIFSKAYFEDRDFEESSLDRPLSSGPYAIGDYDRGVWVEFNLREDYWAKDLPVNRGRWNFESVRIEYFRDREAAFQGLTSGTVDLREEFFSKLWATAYDIPQIADGRIKRDVLPDGRPSGTQGYFINTRREKFQDPRVREALVLAFDFEWSNETLFYGLYKRTDSFFEGAPFEASGDPSPEELALLEPFRDQLPEAVFGPAYIPPVTEGTGNRDRTRRMNLAKAMKLLDAAGWKLVEGKRVNDAGEVFEIEFLDDSSSFARITNPYIQNLERLGIDATFRQVDRPQYQRRQKAYDYDIVTSRLPMESTPNTELYTYFSCQAAQTDDSFNLAGICDPVVDALLDKVMAVGNREELHVTLQALDRVLRAGHYWVPQWTKGTHTIAYWDQFERPETKPPLSRAILDTWWMKPEAAN